MSAQQKILVIKHGALGDMIQALGPCAAIRAHHPDAHILLLTTSPYRELAVASGYFDEILIDNRPKWWQLSASWRLWHQLKQLSVEWVYDLQTSERTACYHRLIQHRYWSGIAAGCSHPDDNPQRDAIHTLERQAYQLNRAGITEVPVPSLSWVNADISHLALPARYVLCFPGGSAHRQRKRWPVEQFIRLGERLLAAGIVPVFDGGPAEATALKKIQQALPDARVLIGQTDLLQLVKMARGALAAVGGDTGPMHIAAVSGCACVVLFSAASNPDRCRPRGQQVEVLRRNCLADLSVGTVWTALAQYIDQAG